MMMSFIDFITKYKLINKTTSNKKIQQILSSLNLNDIKICLRDGLFLGLVIIHPYKGNHCVCYIDVNHFDSFGFLCPEKLSNFFRKRNGCCSFSENKLQGLTSKRDSFSASYCLCKIYMTKSLRNRF